MAANRGACLGASAIGQSKVHEHDIGGSTAGGIDRTGDRTSLPDHRNLPIGREEGRQGPGNHGVILDNQDSHRL